MCATLHAMKRSDAELVREAFELLGDRPEGDRLREIVSELRKRTTLSVGQRKFQTAWTEGRVARRDGIPLEECPYVEKTTQRTFTTARRNAWMRGWQGMDADLRPRNLRRATMRQILCVRRTGTS